MGITEQFDAGTRTAMMANFPGAITALLELIDNGIDDWDGETQEFKPIRIDIEIGPTLKVRTRGETGMGLSELGDFLRWGYSKKRGRIGQWGQGGKAGMGYLARGMRIRCGRRGETVGWNLSDPQWGSRDFLKELEPQSFPKPPEAAFVEIELFDLKREIRPETLIKQLGNVYRPLLESERVKITVKTPKSRRPVYPVPIPLKAEHQQFDVPLSGSARLKGWVGLMEGPLSKGSEVLRGGMRCYHFGRLISQGEYFGHPRPDFRASLNSIVGEVYIDFAVTPHLNKTDFDKESPEWLEIHPAMYQILLPWVNRLLEERLVEVSISEKLRAATALGLVKRAFRQLNAIGRRWPQLSPVAAGHGAQGHSDAQPLPSFESLLAQPVDEFAPSGLDLIDDLELEASEIAAGGGDGHHTNGDAKSRSPLPGLDFEVEAGDGRLRSSLKVIPGGPGEGERTIVVACSNYPAYEAARTRGDLVLYLMETFAFELAKPKGDEISDAVAYKERADAALGLAALAYMKSPARPEAARSPDERGG